jgi:hypothetical protein
MARRGVPHGSRARRVQIRAMSPRSLANLGARLKPPSLVQELSFSLLPEHPIGLEHVLRSFLPAPGPERSGSSTPCVVNPPSTLVRALLRGKVETP